MYESVGYLATIVSSFILVPQIVKVIKTKKSDDLSYGMIALTMASNGLWGTYGFLNGRVPLVVSGAISMIASVALLCLKAKTTRVLETEEKKYFV